MSAFSADISKLMKTMLLAQHTALGRVGRRVAPESASEVLFARTDGQQSFSAAY
jgi:hypothetical protein